MTETWRLMLHPGFAGPRQMAIDEALLRSLSDRSSPVLRFYSWAAPTLSLGCFQSYKKVVQPAFVVHNNICVVRRLTGGRAVLHDREVTYAVVAPLDRGCFNNRSLKETYSAIADALNLALQRMGVERALVALELGQESREPRIGHRESQPQCFVSISQFEIGESSRKIIGSAQKRERDRFLQHGSILLDFDGPLQSAVVQRPDPQIETRIAPLNRLLGRQLSFDEVSRQFASAFESALGIRLEPSELTAAESQLAAELERKYAAEEWKSSGCK